MSLTVYHCLNHFLPDTIAGTEIYTAALVRGLAKRQIFSKVIVPNYGRDVTERYNFEGTEVIKYAEPSVVDRELIAGKRTADGLKYFLEVLTTEQPDIVHFHELAGSNGISLSHVKAAKTAGFRTLMTFHIAKYSCRTGTLMYKNKQFCDGVIRKIRCSKCWLNDRGQKGMKAAIITMGFTLTNALRYNTVPWGTSIGTALAMPFIIQQMRTDLLELQDHTDAFVVLTDWYSKVLQRNDIRSGHITLIKQALPVESFTSNTLPPSNILHLVFIGRINHFKGVLTLLKAVRQIDESKITLDLFGSATDRSYYEECLTVTAGMKNIRWMGSIEPGNVVETLCNYDVLCLPSEVCEMAPLVIQEAFAAGIPVLASDVYGNSEVITHGVNGWLFKFKDTQSLSDQLLSLAINAHEVIEARQNIGPGRKFTQVAEEYEQLYHGINSSV